MTQENVSIAKRESTARSDAEYTIGVCVASAINSPLKLRKMGNNQTPSECKHYKDRKCKAYDNMICVNTLFSVRYGYQKPNCCDYKLNDRPNGDKTEAEL